MAESVEKILGHYALLDRLGAGGMGEVYHARDEKLGRSVALKLLPPEMASDPARLERFEREARALAALNHPGIVTIYSIEQSESTRFLTMELVRGKTLADVIPDGGLPLSEFFELAIPLSDALGAAHERGIVHRDLKPRNVMLSETGQLKVLDFGLAKLRTVLDKDEVTDLPTSHLTQIGLVMGTVPYMSPEQAQGRIVDYRSDIFSLGILLYEMLTGRRPFEGDSQVEVLSKILRETPPFVTELNPGVPPALGSVLERCLEKEPEQRYQMAAELKTELQAVSKELGRLEATLSLARVAGRAEAALAGRPGRREAKTEEETSGFDETKVRRPRQRRPHPGARWLRCDLHARTPIAALEPVLGESWGAAVEALRELKADRLAHLAEEFVASCVRGAGEQGLDLVVLADPGSVEGYKRLRPFFDSIAQRARHEDWLMPAILPGIELSVGGKHGLHFLAIFSPQTPIEEIEALLEVLFDGGSAFDRNGSPRAAAKTIHTFLDRLYGYCKPPDGERSIPFVLLLTRLELKRRPNARSRTKRPPASEALLEELTSQMRQRVTLGQDWHGLIGDQPFDRLQAPLQELLMKSWAAHQREDWDALSSQQKQQIAGRGYWPIVASSDPERGDAAGTSFVWMKLEMPDVEGLRLALVDPESRLRTSKEGPPGLSYPVLRRIRLQKMDFFEDLTVSFSPCLTTLIGGRGSGKSSVLECLRFVLDRARASDFQEHEKTILESVNAFRAGRKRQRDFGETPGIFLPGYEVELDLFVAGTDYRASLNASHQKPRVLAGPELSSSKPGGIDVRALVAPRILSQGQIAQIARDPAAQRRELDALLDPEAIRRFEERRRTHFDRLRRLQLKRHKLLERHATLPTRETELRKIQDQIELLERGGSRRTLRRYHAYQAEQTWLDQTLGTLRDAAADLDRLNTATRERAEAIEEHGAGPTKEFTRRVFERSRRTLAETANVLRGQNERLQAAYQSLGQEMQKKWKPGQLEAIESYGVLAEEMQKKGVDFGEHERLLEKRKALEKEIEELRRLDEELAGVRKKLRGTREKLVKQCQDRLEKRQELAERLEIQNADIRMEIFAFADQKGLLQQRDQWFGGTGLREQDWEVLAEAVFDEEPIPERLLELVEALRADVERTTHRGESLEPDESEVARWIGEDRAPRLSKHFFNALQNGDRIRLDELERFLPEDHVEARVRGADGSFKPMSQGSIGQRSTAILSLLLSAGNQPLIIDQPEDDLDNQYVYSAVVGLLRRRKFSRQLIIATHNANIPVNGDAELIVALGVEGEERLGRVLAAGSIDSPEVKSRVSSIMEGSREAFRLRQERYGY